MFSSNMDVKSIATHLGVGAGLLYLGYRLGASSATGKKRAIVAKSFERDPEEQRILNYCLDHSTAMHPVQKQILEDTVKHPRAGMMGAPEVVMLNAALIKAIDAKKVLDIGVFTGASSLAAALALPDDGRIVACDVSEEFTRPAVQYWKQAGVDHKVELVIGPATQTLQRLISDGEVGTFDFAFIDADKAGYSTYYDQCLVLLRKGGIIAFDNTLWKERVADPEVMDETTNIIRKLNEKIAKDVTRNFAVLLNIGDGYTLVVKQ